MKRIIISVMIAALGVAFLTHCREKEQAKHNAKQVVADSVYFNVSDTAHFLDDLNRSIANGDLRFVGVMGYALTVPGVPHYYDEIYSKRLGVKIIEGTSDSYMDSTALARAVFWETYATNYNTALLKYLTDNKK